MNEIKEPAKKQENPKLAEFRKLLNGWMTSPDGEDFCPESWGRYKNRIRSEFTDSESTFNMFRKDSTSTGGIAETRRSSDGWFAQCAEEGCKNEAFVPYD